MPDAVVGTDRVAGTGEPTGRPAGAPMRRLDRFGWQFLAVWLPMLLWWLAVLPGGMSADSLDSWGQIQSGHWTNHHPVPFTAFVWLTSGGGSTPATTTLVQTVVVASALTFFARSVARVCGAGRWPWSAAVLLAVLPLAGAFSVIMWKDIPETAALLVVAGMLVRASTGSGSKPRPGWLLGLGAVCAAVALLRWNGVGTVLVAAVAALLLLPRSWRWRTAAVMAAASLAGFGFLLLLPRVTGVPPVQAVDRQLDELVDLAQLARHTPQAFTAADRRVLARVAPFPRWAAAGYHCYEVAPVANRLIRAHDLTQRLDANSSAVSAVWRRVAAREPGQVLRSRLCLATLAWNPAPPYAILTLWEQVSPNSWGLHPMGWRPLRQAATQAARTAYWRWVQVAFWRPALWFLLAAAAGALAARRVVSWRTQALLLAVPLGVLLSYAAAPASQDARYTYASVLICQLTAVGYLGTVVRRRRAAAAPQVR